MDVLMSELSKHKRKREEVEPAPNKYQKRGDLEKEKLEQLRKEEEEKKRIALEVRPLWFFADGAERRKET